MSLPSLQEAARSSPPICSRRGGGLEKRGTFWEELYLGPGYDVAVSVLPRIEAEEVRLNLMLDSGPKT